MKLHKKMFFALLAINVIAYFHKEEIFKKHL